MFSVSYQNNYTSSSAIKSLIHTEIKACSREIWFHGNRDIQIHSTCSNNHDIAFSGASVGGGVRTSKNN